MADKLEHFLSRRGLDVDGTCVVVVANLVVENNKRFLKVTEGREGWGWKLRHVETIMMMMMMIR